MSSRHLPYDHASQSKRHGPKWLHHARTLREATAVTLLLLSTEISLVTDEVDNIVLKLHGKEHGAVERKLCYNLQVLDLYLRDVNEIRKWTL